MPHDEDDLTAKARRQQRVTLMVIVGSFVLIIALVVGFALFVNANRPEPKGPAVVTFDSYEADWTSAMAKAGVEATFPVEPVALTDLEADGMHPFSATFTAEEISALLTMHPFAYEINGGEVSLQRPVIGFPAPGLGSFAGKLVYGTTGYSARAEAPASYAVGAIVIDAADASLTVEGFGVGGERRDQAIGAVEDYLNALVRAAPRLTVERAEITAQGLEVEGIAPDRLIFPAPEVPTEQPAE